MTPQEQQLNTLMKMVETLNTQYVSVADFTSAVAVISQAIKKGEGKSEKETEGITNELHRLSEKMSSGDAVLKGRIDTQSQKFQVGLEEIKRLVKNVSLTPGPKGDKGDKGDAGDTVVGPPGKDGSPDTAEDIRNKLELLSGDERLDRAYIRGLEGLPTPQEFADVKRIAQSNATSLPQTTSFINGKRAKNINFTGATVGYSGDTAEVTITGGGGGGTWGSITGTLSAQTDLQTALDTKVDENSAITGATKTKITYDTKGLVTAGTDATTADIADSANKRYVTDANLTVIGNTSGTNTGDNATNTTYASDYRAANFVAGTNYQAPLVSGTSIKTINSTSLLGSGDIAISSTDATKLPLAGGTMTGGIVLVAGTTTIQPIKMVAGVNLTTPVAGVFEFDGTNLYFSV